MSRRARLIRAASRRCGRIARRDMARDLPMSLSWIGAFQGIGDLIAMPTVRGVRR